MDLSSDQTIVLTNLIDWVNYKHKDNFITLGGYAGTGKSTLIAELRKQLDLSNKDLKVAFCSYTGKATQVLKIKLLTLKVLFPKDNISTIHSLIYSPLTSEVGQVLGWEKKEKLNFDLIVVDEASMLNSIIWQDLLSYKIPIIAVGDHGQLPPIEGTFNLMLEPMLKLEKIHRQAENNPIIKLSMLAREEGEIKVGNYSGTVRKILRQEVDSQESITDYLANYSPENLILCGYNFTRIKLNRYIRSNFEYSSAVPAIGDKVICLRNNHSKQIFNGMTGTIKSLESENNDSYYTEINLSDEGITYKGLIAKSQFNSPKTLSYNDKLKGIDLFDFGYALTVHKAQGSQANKVLLFEEKFPQMNDDLWRRWLYTGITRATEGLLLVGT